MRTTAIGLLALAWLTGVAARDLPVPADKGWQHARTGLVLTATLDGLPRVRLLDTTAGEWDVMVRFADPGEAVIASVYLYHPAVDDVTLWFERSRVQIQERDVYGGVEATTAEPVAFAVPGSGGAPAALRQTFRTSGEYRSTALAMMPLGEWLVAVRLSARDRDTAALDERLTRIVAAIRWPKAPPAAPALHPIAACPTPLAFEKAKVVKSQGADMLMTLLGASIAADPKAHAETKRAAWCRDPASNRLRGVYRPVDGSPGYMIALQDAGRTMGVWPSLGAQIGKEGAAPWSISLAEVDGSTSVLPSFDRLPAPDQVVALASGPVSGRVAATPGKKPGDRTITIDPTAL